MQMGKTRFLYPKFPSCGRPGELIPICLCFPLVTSFSPNPGQIKWGVKHGGQRATLRTGGIREGIQRKWKRREDEREING